MASIIHALLVVLVLVLLARLLVSSRRRRDVARPRLTLYGRGRQAENGKGVSMVPDPECGRFVVVGSSPAASIDGEPLYFCGDECRERHGRRRIAKVVSPRPPPSRPARRRRRRGCAERGNPGGDWQEAKGLVMEKAFAERRRAQEDEYFHP